MLGKAREIHTAVLKRDIEAVTKIIATKIQKEKRYSIDITNENGQTPLHFAADTTEVKMVRLLIEKGANINARDYCSRTPLIFLCSGKSYSGYGKDFALDVVKLLVEAGADVNAKDFQGDSAFDAACKSGLIATAHYLFPSTQDFDSEDQDGKTLLVKLCEASYFDRSPIIQFLLEKGADPHKVPEKIYQKTNSETRRLLDTYKEKQTTYTHAASCESRVIKLTEVKAAPLKQGNELEARALYDYQATLDTELSIKAADLLTVLEQDNSGWWYCELNGKYGYVPSNYLSLVSNKAKVEPTEETLTAKILTLIQKAERGDREAQYDLGLAYANGQGIAQDNAQAVIWYQKAANQGHATAQCNLGSMYENGYGVKQDYAQAVYWYRKAAEQGLATGQRSLGVMYDHGLGVKQDDTQALYWYQKAADQGEAIAQTNLGLMYAKGRAVKQDYTQAVYWYQKAVDQGIDVACSNLGVMYVNGHGVKQDYTQAVRLFQKAADQGNAGAQQNLGAMYSDGMGVKQDDAQAIYWHRKAADQGESAGQYSLGGKYENGRGVKQDTTQAVYWYQKAAEKNYAQAIEALKRLEVKQAEVDPQKTSILPASQPQKAAQQKHELTSSPLSLRKNEVNLSPEVLTLLQQAAKGDSEAQFNLGLRYANGREVKQDDEQAVLWYKKAADQGASVQRF